MILCFKKLFPPRNDVRIAQKEAFNEGYAGIAEKHLLLGILQSENPNLVSEYDVPKS
ncbi:MAG: hypothetical protein WAM42_01960 [Candidatus Nitrosopolaris sp.]